jgi:hypothetical protein
MEIEIFELIQIKNIFAGIVVATDTFAHIALYLVIIQKRAKMMDALT